MNARFLAIASDPRLIPGVHHYCDEWCDYCPVTNRCLAYRCTDDWRAQRNRPAGGSPFASREEAVAFTRELAEVEGETTEELDALMSAKPGRSDIRTSDALADLAWEYALLASVLLMHLPDDVSADQDTAGGPSPIEVILWYHVRIYMKIFRALVARDRTAAGKADRAEDATGCAKLALVSIQRSRAALPSLIRDGNAAHIARLEAQLAALEHGIDARFPQARGFVRIGLDVPAAA
jgi:hypothetical protein